MPAVPSEPPLKVFNSDSLRDLTETICKLELLLPKLVHDFLCCVDGAARRCNFSGPAFRALDDSHETIDDLLLPIDGGLKLVVFLLSVHGQHLPDFVFANAPRPPFFGDGRTFSQTAAIYLVPQLGCVSQEDPKNQAPRPLPL
jgi:hypothetical protein